MENTIPVLQDILIVNINWNKKEDKPQKKKKEVELPEMLTLSLPANLKNQEGKLSEAEFFDAIEQFTYNFLYKKYNNIVNRCQIYIVV